MPVEYRKIIRREMLQAEPEKLFVFGDNLERVGLGGQAAEMRGELNAVGIPTKVSPSMEPSAFFTDASVMDWASASLADFERLVEHARAGGTIVWPVDDIGTGLAQLPQRAPLIWQQIQNRKKQLEAL